jgi:MOSC domain-containing protein YiiM
MKIISVNTGLVAPLFIKADSNAQTVRSAIRKQAVTGKLAVGPLGLAGDEQADLSVHGGLDKAVYAYPAEHYAFWEAEAARLFKQRVALPYGSLGENLTTEGLFETDLWIGDRVQAGELLLEVTEPRQPCFKFAARMGYAHAVKQMLQSGYSGVYLKVVQTADVEAGLPLQLLPGARQVSVASINERRLKGRQRDLF